jgi:glutamate-1-semialdehyde 2,1-aminomutase
MEQVAPAGPVYQAGTLSGNPIAMTAGLVTVRMLEDSSYKKLESLGAQLEDGLVQSLAQRKVPGQVQRVGSMWTLFFNENPVSNYSQAKTSDTAAYGRFFHGMLERGFYLPPSQFEAAFIALSHTAEDIEATIAAADEVLGSLNA